MLAVLLAVFVSTTPHDAPTRPGITFEEAMRLAEQAPAAQAARQAAKDKRAVDRSIHGLGNPEIGIKAGARKAEGDSQGFDGELNFVQPIPLAPVGRDRRQAAAAESRLLDEKARLHVLEAQTQAAEAFFRLHASEAKLREMETRVSLAEEILETMQQGQESGAFTSRDVAAAKASLAEARLRSLDAEGEVFASGIDLAVALGTQQPVAFRALGPIPTIDLPPRDTWEQALDPSRSPAVLAGRLEEEAARARAKETETEGRAFWLGVGGDVVQEGEETAVLGTLTLTLPLFERSVRAHGTALAEARTLEGEHRAALAGASAQAIAWMHDVDHTALVLRLAEDELLPAAEESARLTALSYRANQVILLDLFHALDELAEVRARVHQARADHALARVRLFLLLQAMQ